MSGKHGWTCAACTFEHQFPGTRCVMCQSLRTTKEQMIDFIKGKPIPESSKVNSALSTKKKLDNTKATAVKTNQPPPDEADEPTNDLVKQPSVKVFFTGQNSSGDLMGQNSRNPYSLKGSNSKNMSNAENPQRNNHDRSTDSRASNSGQVTADSRKRSAAQSNQMSIRPSNNALEGRPKKGQKIGLLPMPQRSHSGQPTDRQLKQRVESLSYVPGPVAFDRSALSEWIYPINPAYARRDYQVEISEAALFENTLVSLPTGLGKTMIAAVVLYNYYRWFPRGKLIFCAPTLPLVRQ